MCKEFHGRSGSEDIGTDCDTRWDLNMGNGIISGSPPVDM
jgi:hypothetical protein